MSSEFKLWKLYRIKHIPHVLNLSFTKFLDYVKLYDWTIALNTKLYYASHKYIYNTARDEDNFTRNVL